MDSIERLRINETTLVHVTFAQSVRVMLMDKSTPLLAVTGHMLSADENYVLIRPKTLFPAGAAPVKGSPEIIVRATNIIGIVEVKTP